MTHPPRPAVGRRQLLGISISAAGAIALAACDKPQPKAAERGAPAEDETPVTPPEDLMREHGVLKRVLLIYREGIRRLQANEQLPADALNAGAAVIRSFIEDYHEQLEEQHVFPKLEQAGKLTDVTSVLRTQHQRGRVLTDRVLAATTPRQRSIRRSGKRWSRTCRPSSECMSRMKRAKIPSFSRRCVR